MNYEFFSLTMILRCSVPDDIYWRAYCEFLVNEIATDENR